MGRKEKTILVTIIANLILIALRFFLADISGSIGLLANAYHSFTDVFVTSVVFIGLMVTRFYGEKAGAVSKKIEHLLALFVSVFIFYIVPFYHDSSHPVSVPYFHKYLFLTLLQTFFKKQSESFCNAFTNTFS